MISTDPPEIDYVLSRMEATSKFPASMNFRSLEHLSFWHVTMQQSTEKLRPLDIDATHSSASGKSALALANGGWHCHGAEVS